MDAEPTAGEVEIPPTEALEQKDAVKAEAIGMEGEALEASLDREGGTTPMPHPMSVMQEEGHGHLPLLHPDHLKLIFELQSLVEDLIHRISLVSQQLDLLYEAYSNTPPGKRCPTCAQKFVLIATEDCEGDMDEGEATG